MRDAALPYPWISDKLLLGLPPRTYLRSLLTWGNVLAFSVLVVGLPLIGFRFIRGLGAVTHLSQTSPWGIWIGLDILCGVALAAGGYTLAAAVYLLGLEAYRPVLRPAILTGFLGYLFAVLGLLCDLGQPWRIVYPVFVSHGATSVMFEVGWCVFLYLVVLFLEFLPSAFEWLGWTKAKRRLSEITVGVVVLGVLLSTLHQSSLGSLFLMAPGRLHPLWYSSLIPVLFFVSSIAAGLGMVILEGRLSHRFFAHRVSHDGSLDRITLGLGRGSAVVLFSLFFLRLQGLVESGRWDLLRTGYGGLFLLETVGLILVPSVLFARAARRGSVGGVRFAAVLSIAGVILNRLDVSLFTFNWDAPERYVPSLAEIWVSLTLITLGVLTFRWIVNRMPIFGRAHA